MNALEALQRLKENAGYSHDSPKGVYADLSQYPKSISYYVKCPKCGITHGSFKDLKQAMASKLCTPCNRDAMEKVRDEVSNAVHKRGHKPLKMSKIFGY